jgi:hypothetical protein
MAGKRALSTIRRPVRREGADHNLLITLIAFAASVALTRLFLELTGYPQLGGGELHIAHVLWGGLLLFIAALLPLILANRWVYPLSALLAGLGVGLFIDEVGKFLTQTNDYFYPAAAPIIYAFFLLTVLLFLQIRRPLEHDPRSELYRAFDILQEILDRDLEPAERLDLQRRLRHVANHAEQPNISHLADSLLECLTSDTLVLAPERRSFGERIFDQLRAIESRWFSERRLRALLVAGLMGLGCMQLVALGQLLHAAVNPIRWGEMVANLMALGNVASASAVGWFAARLALEGTVGLVFLCAAILLLTRRRAIGIQMAYFALLLLLAAVNLLVFYFEQFSSIIITAIEFLILLGVLRYRVRYLRLPRLGQAALPDQLDEGAS